MFFVNRIAGLSRVAVASGFIFPAAELTRVFPLTAGTGIKLAVNAVGTSLAVVMNSVASMIASITTLTDGSRPTLTHFAGDWSANNAEVVPGIIGNVAASTCRPGAESSGCNNSAGRRGGCEMSRGIMFALLVAWLLRTGFLTRPERRDALAGPSDLPDREASVRIAQRELDPLRIRFLQRRDLCTIFISDGAPHGPKSEIYYAA